MSETHGAPTTRERAAAKRTGQPVKPAQPAKVATTGIVGEVERELKDLLAPLRKRLAQLNRDIDARQAELGELRKARTYVEGTIRKLEPAAANLHPNARTLNNGARRAAAIGYERKKENTRAYVIANAAELREGFTVQQLTEAMKRDGVTPSASSTKVAQIVEELRDQGVVRADRVTRGGGMQWIVVQTENGRTGGNDGAAQT